MKLAWIVAFFTAPAFADMVCDAREIRVGQGRSGTVLVTENPFSVRWQGDANDIVGKGTLCGVKLNHSTVCQVLDHSFGPTLSAKMMCADKNKDPFNNTVGQGYFVFSQVNGVGRLGCSNAEGPVETLIEINGCR